MRRPRRSLSHSEDEVLRKIANSLSSPAKGIGASLDLGIGDDAALFRLKAGYQTILTCDWFLEGTHFLREKHLTDSVGWKSLARAISDVAAMGGVPRCFLLSLALPRTHTGRWLDQFLSGLRRAARRFECPLAGGDTTRREEILINVTVVGEVRTGRVIRRSGARAGDILLVSGRLGEAELGLQMLKRSKGHGDRRNPLTRKHLYPEPRVALGQWLTDTRLASSMMDLSDGLSSDLPRLCVASGVGARVEMTKLPMVRASNYLPKGGRSLIHHALHGGDDYELLFTVPRRLLSRIPAVFEGAPLTAIGEITNSKKLLLIHRGGRAQPLLPGGWDPFRVAR